jgi:plastocyanin
MMNRSILRWSIAALGLFTAMAHLTLNIPFSIESTHFTLNGLGYLALLGALFINPPRNIPLISFITGQRRLIHYAFMGYTAVSIVAWVFLGKPYTMLGYVTKADEVLLILALWQHSRGTAPTALTGVASRIIGASAMALVGLTVLSGFLYMELQPTVSDEVKAGAILVDMKNVLFDPDRLEVQAGETAKIVVKNKDFIGHTFTIEELGIDFTFLPLNERLIELPPLVAGEYSYICTVPGHEAMRGTLVVMQ